MILLLSAIAPIIVFAILSKRHFDNILVMIGLIISCLWVFILSFSFVIQRVEQNKELAELKAFEQALMVARSSGDHIERAALAGKIAEWNQRIATVKYWNDGVWDWWNVDELANHAPVQ